VADLDETFVSSERHDQNRELDDSRFFMPLDIGFLNNRLILHFLLLLYLLKQLYYPTSLFGVILEINCQLFLMLF
jgi:hypothetical protein